MKHKNESDLINEGWSSMSQILDKEMPIKKSRKKIFFWLFSAGLALVLAINILIITKSQSNQVPSAGDNQLIVENSKQEIKNKSIAVNEEPELGVETILPNNSNSIKSVDGKNKLDFYDSNNGSSDLEMKTISTEIKIDKAHVFNSDRMNSASIVSLDKFNPSETNPAKNINNNKISLTELLHNETGDIQLSTNADAISDPQGREKLNYININSLALLPLRSDDNELNAHFVTPIKESNKFKLGMYVSSGIVLSENSRSNGIGLSLNLPLGAFGFSMNIGYEHIVTESNIERDNVDVSILLGDTAGSIADINSSPDEIINSISDSGIDVSQFVTDQKYFIADLMLDYYVLDCLEISTGVGYKRLLNVDNNDFNIGAITAGNFEVELARLEKSFLDSNAILNRNRFYIPMRMQLDLTHHFSLGVSYNRVVTPLANNLDIGKNNFNGSIYYFF